MAHSPTVAQAIRDAQERLRAWEQRLVELARLRRQARKHGITNRAIAAACVPVVDPSCVSHFFAGRGKSATNIEPTVRRLIAEREAALAREGGDAA